MGKLLSNTYEREWHDRLQKWQDKQDKNEKKSQAFLKKDEPPARSEYHSTFAKSSRISAPGSNRAPR